MTPPLVVQVVTHGGYNIAVIPAGAHAAAHAAAQATGPAVEVWSTARNTKSRRENMVFV